jgi:thioesterase domain-containing protein
MSDADVKGAELLDRVRSVLHSQRVHKWSSLVAIQPQGSRLPLFGIHPANGEVFFYHRLASLLGPDQPVYGLRARGLDRKSEPLDRVEDIAAAYIREVALVQPHGPYVIVGRCNGSRVAYEMAQQLSRSGEAIGLLCLIDPGPISTPTSALGRLEDLGRYIRYHVARRDLRRAIVRSIRPRLRRVRSRFDAVGRAVHRGRSGEPPQVTARQARDALLNTLASSSYKAAPYPGKVLFFAAADAVRHVEPRASWEQLAELELKEVPGDHRTIGSPENLPVLAAHLRHRLDKVSVPPA